MIDVPAEAGRIAACARRGDWEGYAERFSALREALFDHPELGADEAVRRHLEVLGAASPRHDPEGCAAELEALAHSVRGRVAQSAPPPMDLRGLQPPEPMIRILDALERAPHQPLRVVLPHEPAPLYPMLRDRGFRWTGAPRPDGGYDLRIEHL